MACPLRQAASDDTRAAVSSGTSSLRSYASAVRGSRIATRSASPSHACSSSATRSPISASRAIQHSRSPERANAAARKLLAPCGTEVSPACRPVFGSSPSGEPSRSRSDPNVPVSASSGGRTERSGNLRAPRPGSETSTRRALRLARPCPSPARRASAAAASTSAMSKSTAFASASACRLATSRANCSLSRRSAPLFPRGSTRPLTSRPPAVASAASPSSSVECRPGREGRRSRPAPRCGPRRPAEARTR